MVFWAHEAEGWVLRSDAIPGRLLVTPPPSSSSCTFLICGVAKNLDISIIGIMVPKSTVSLYRRGIENAISGMQKAFAFCKSYS